MDVRGFLNDAQFLSRVTVRTNIFYTVKNVVHCIDDVPGYTVTVDISYVAPYVAAIVRLSPTVYCSSTSSVP